MPANLPPQYFSVQERLKQASTDDEKLAIYEELLSIVPKHKGSEKVQKELKSKISKIKKEMQGSKKGASRFVFHIPKEGAGQIILFGPANSGKSSIFTQLTGVDTEISDFPYTTRDYKIGMMKFENIQIQIVDTPPVLHNFMDKWLSSVIKLADLSIYVFDPSSDDVLDQFDLVNSKLSEKNLCICGSEPEKFAPKVLYIANKWDKSNFEKNFSVFNEFYPSVKALKLSANDHGMIEELKKTIFQRLEIMRVYCKPQGKAVDYNKPVILKLGNDVVDFAKDLGKGFVSNLKHARLINKENSQGILVSRDYKLVDGDTIELYINE
ncbi:MAG: 50S ribosome-binding GTPase [Planctomycetes bacterium]|nr:50S ribosome-binding GTPase [Planctomycetota bacterium]